MNSISLIRRIDELGRVVIPKEYRKKLKINSNDNLELYINDDCIMIKRHNYLDNNIKIIKMYGDIAKNLTNKNIIITNKQKIIYCNNHLIKTFLNKELTDEIINVINNRKELSGTEIELIKNININNFYCLPIIVDSDSVGLLIMFSNEITSDDKIVLKIINKILNSSLE